MMHWKQFTVSVALPAMLWSACDTAAEGGVTGTQMYGTAGTTVPTSTTVAAGAGAAGRPSTSVQAGAASSAVGVAGAAAAGTTAIAPVSVAGANAAAAGTPAPTTGAAGSAGTTTAAAGSAGTPSPVAGSGGAATQAGAGGIPAEHMDLGMGDGHDVITIGDSWMSYAVNGGGIETGLLAASGQPYRTYGVAGTMLLDEVIPNQYESAKRINKDIKTVVMTGGGNDLLLTGMTAGGCGEGCMSTIEKVGARLAKLWDEMATDGVQDVVYIEYSRGGSNKAGVEYGAMTIMPLCAAAKLRCHFIDSDPIINMVLLDGVHPTADGCRKLGKAAFDLMVKEGMRR